MKIANSVLFGTFVLAASSLLPAQDHQSVTSSNPCNVSAGTLVFSSDALDSIRPDKVLAPLSGSAGYPDPEMASAAVLSDFYNEAPLNDARSSSADRADPSAESAVLSDFYNEAPLNDASSALPNCADPPAESTDQADPGGQGPVADSSMPIENYNALVRQGFSPTDAKQIAQITRETGI